MSGYLLDTHVWLWAQRGETEKFTAEMQLELENHQRQRQVFVSAISVLEVARLVALQQYFLSLFYR